jgi:carbon-monoxide dehydrogenase small subunit
MGEKSMKRVIQLIVNGNIYDVMISPRDVLVDVLRKQLGFTGTKKGCGHGDCGTCTVLINDRPTLSCLTLAIACQGKKIVTIEGLEKNGVLHPIQQSFVDHGAVQCGFCTPGMIMNAYAMLLKNPRLTREQIITGMDNNFCRCSGHKRIVQAIESVAKKR